MFVAASEALVTIVVVTYNGARYLGRCLDAVAAQGRASQHGIACWVVDNASVDGSAELLAARTDGVRVIRSSRNLGFAGGNNLALREVSTSYVVLLNDDAEPQADWLDELLRPFDDRRVAAVTAKLLLMPRFVTVRLPERGGRVDVLHVRRDGEVVTDAIVWDPLLVAPATGRVRPCRSGADLLVPVLDPAEVLPEPVEVVLELAGGLETQPIILPAGTATCSVVNSAGTVLTHDAYAADRGFGVADDGRFDSPAEVFGGCGASLALRTAALADAGLFDDDWFLYYEDVDLCWRLRRRGWVVRYAPRAVVRHQHSATVGTRSDLHVFHDNRNRLLTLVKNGSRPLALGAVARYPLTTASMGLRALRTPCPQRRSVAMYAVLLRLRVLVSFLRLLPRVLLRRRAIQRSATVSRRDVESWRGRDTGPGPLPTRRTKDDSAMSHSQGAVEAAAPHVGKEKS